MWMKVDDGLHAHRKTRAVTKGADGKARDAAPMGLWILAGSWAAQNNRDGWVPQDELDRWDDDWEALAKRLVHAGYWWPEQRDGESGYGFNDWQEWNNPDGASASGTFGNHVRWHVNKGVVKPDCEHCPEEPPSDSSPSVGAISGRLGAMEGLGPETGVEKPLTLGEEAISAGQAPSHRGDIAPDIATSIGATRLPDPTRPEPHPTRPGVSSVPAKREIGRDDVERICEHLANRIEANGSKRPTIGARWRTAARLMLDADKRSEEEVHGSIDWSQNDEFWRTVVLSMPKLREKFDQMRLQAQARSSRVVTRQQETNDLFDRAIQRGERTSEP